MYECFFFFFNDTATTEIYTLSLHDALPISHGKADVGLGQGRCIVDAVARHGGRSEEHTSELQSRLHLVCRLLLEKKKNIRRHPLTRVCSLQLHAALVGLAMEVQ